MLLALLLSRIGLAQSPGSPVDSLYRPHSPVPTTYGTEYGSSGGPSSMPQSPPSGVYSGHSFLTTPQLNDPACYPDYPAGVISSPPDIRAMQPVAIDWHQPEVAILPQGLLYKSYLAGEKEPRISSAYLVEDERGLVWDVTLGGRVGLWRYGTPGAVDPQGFQLDLEGGAMVRLDPEEETDVEAADFRFGFLMTWREGPWATKAGYYHVSSHLGDEFLLRNPGFPRRNYVRDSALAGISFDATPEVRLYSEVAYAIGHEGGALPLEFQYGTEYSSRATGSWGGPYAAINGHTREDQGWITGVNIVSGWQWLGVESRHRFRVGMQYYHGPALQYSFVGRRETLLGGGLWFDY
ncbi:MAG: DUF1207 domain-containing protein [Planctomycetaceae bacterium]|nr:DUF1207 domain-containing protein [Planctomycetaceae bacterium]